MKQNLQDDCLFVKKCPYYEEGVCTAENFIYCSKRTEFQEGYGTPSARIHMVFSVTSEMPVA